jgi:tRNA nucleotidyltransferase (CCA-adding enzyme)
MQAGEVYISSEDSLENLQRLMIDTGWGQIPVIDSQTKKIIGIVTRTDLIKTLSPRSRLPDRHKLISKLEAVLPLERLTLLKAISQAALEQHTALYVVGGFVRDLLLDIPSLDFDLVVEGDAIQLAKLLASRWGGRVTSHNQFGTAKWHLADSNFDSRYSQYPLETVDLVSARTEFYTHPSALPTVEPGSIKLDLHRRDFTINTLALRLDGRHYGELHDYYGGLNDLRSGVVRVLHSLSFVDDPTRILRAVRFEQRFGFTIDERTLFLAGEARSLIEKLSGDRIRHEINHILSEPKVDKIFERLSQLGFLQSIHPCLRWDSWLHEKIKNMHYESLDQNWGVDHSFDHLPVKSAIIYCLLLIRNPHEDIVSICERLKMAARLTNQITAASLLWHEMPQRKEGSPSQIVSLLDETPPLSRYVAYLATDDPDVRTLLERYTHQWQKIHPITTGNDLKAMAIPPGPIYKTILDQLRSAWLDGKIKSVAEEKRYLENLVHNRSSLT